MENSRNAFRVAIYGIFRREGRRGKKNGREATRFTGDGKRKRPPAFLGKSTSSGVFYRHRIAREWREYFRSGFSSFRPSSIRLVRTTALLRNSEMKIGVNRIYLSNATRMEHSDTPISIFFSDSFLGWVSSFQIESTVPYRGLERDLV